MCASTLTVLFGVERPVLWVMVGAREAEGSQTLLLGAEGLLNMVVFFFLTVSSIYLYLYRLMIFHCFKHILILSLFFALLLFF